MLRAFSFVRAGKDSEVIALEVGKDISITALQ
jgi:hypothetical protein